MIYTTVTLVLLAAFQCLLMWTLFKRDCRIDELEREVRSAKLALKRGAMDASLLRCGALAKRLDDAAGKVEL